MERNVLARGTQHVSYTFSKHISHLSATILCSVPAWIMTCQCFLSFALSVVIWFLAILSFTRYCHLSFGLPQFRFPSTVISYIFLVASSAFAHVQTISTSSLRGILPLVACVPVSQTSIVYFRLSLQADNCTFCTLTECFQVLLNVPDTWICIPTHTGNANLRVRHIIKCPRQQLTLIGIRKYFHLSAGQEKPKIDLSAIVSSCPTS